MQEDLWARETYSQHHGEKHPVVVQQTLSGGASP